MRKMMIAALLMPAMAAAQTNENCALALLSGDQLLQSLCGYSAPSHGDASTNRLLRQIREELRARRETQEWLRGQDPQPKRQVCRYDHGTGQFYCEEIPQ